MRKHSALSRMNTAAKRQRRDPGSFDIRIFENGLRQAIAKRTGEVLSVTKILPVGSDEDLERLLEILRQDVGKMEDLACQWAMLTSEDAGGEADNVTSPSPSKTDASPRTTRKRDSKARTSGDSESHSASGSDSDNDYEDDVDHEDHEDDEDEDQYDSDSDSYSES